MLLLHRVLPFPTGQRLSRMPQDQTQRNAFHKALGPMCLCFPSAPLRTCTQGVP